MAQVFTALGDEHRQRILLMFRDGEELTIKQIADRVPLSRTAVVHHINTLRTAGVLVAERRGKDVFVKPDPAKIVVALGGVRDYIEEEFGK
jgi:ArsR family transcriptional regulator